MSHHCSISIPFHASGKSRRDIKNRGFLGSYATSLGCFPRHTQTLLRVAGVALDPHCVVTGRPPQPQPQSPIFLVGKSSSSCLLRVTLIVLKWGPAGEEPAVASGLLHSAGLAEQEGPVLPALAVGQVPGQPWGSPGPAQSR